MILVVVVPMMMMVMMLMILVNLSSHHSRPTPASTLRGQKLLPTLDYRQSGSRH